MESNGRDTRGFFAAGNTFGRGHSGSKRIAELRRKLLSCAADDDIEAIYKSMLNEAKGGDVAAARVLLEYLIGKPAQALELSGPEGVPLSLGAIVGVIREAVGDDQQALIRIAAGFRAMGQRSLGDDDVPMG